MNCGLEMKGQETKQINEKDKQQLIHNQFQKYQN